MSEQLLEIQPSLIQKFMKRILKDDQFIISSNLKSKFSRSLTIFMHYIMTISSQISKEKHRATVTIEDLKKALTETGWEEEILEPLEGRVLGLGILSTKSRKIQKENIDESDINNNSSQNKNILDNQNGEIDIDDEIKSDNEGKQEKNLDKDEEEKINIDVDININIKETQEQTQEL